MTYRLEALSFDGRFEMGCASFVIKKFRLEQFWERSKHTTMEITPSEVKPTPMLLITAFSECQALESRDFIFGILGGPEPEPLADDIHLNFTDVLI